MRCLAIVLVAACSTPPIGMDASVEVDASEPMRWEEIGCELTDVQPLEGEQAFCPSVHEWRRVLDSTCYDSSIWNDAGPIDCDAGDGGACRPRMWLEQCSQWVRCPALATELPCWHCLDYGDSPFALRGPIPHVDGGLCSRLP